MNEMIYIPTRKFEFCSSTFTDVPVILQYGFMPLIQLVEEETAGFTIEIPIYHEDGTYLAKAVGSRLFVTPEGKKAGVKMKHPGLMTVCEMNGKPIFEIRRTEAASLRTGAELYTYDGCFVKSGAGLTDLMKMKNSKRMILGSKPPGEEGGIFMAHSTIGPEDKRTDRALTIPFNRYAEIKNCVIRNADIGIQILPEGWRVVNHEIIRP